MSWALAALLAALGVPTATHLPGKLLVFEFRGGGRAGYGKITGTAAPSKLSNGAIAPEDTSALLAQCRLFRFTTIYNSHYATVYAASTGDDVTIVDCFKSRTFRSFDVGWGSLDTYGGARIEDDRSFRRFWRIQP